MPDPRVPGMCKYSVTVFQNTKGMFLYLTQGKETEEWVKIWDLGRELNELRGQSVLYI